MTHQTPTSQTKKEPYTGDPNARLTICPKKLRRHLGRDLVYLSVPLNSTESPQEPHVVATEGVPAPDASVIAVICKHCNGDPVIYKDEPTAEKDAA